MVVVEVVLMVAKGTWIRVRNLVSIMNKEFNTLGQSLDGDDTCVGVRGGGHA